MHFVQSGTKALCVLAALFSSTLSLPVGDSPLIADDSAAFTLSQRDLLIAADDAVPTLTGNGLSKRANPPSASDFQQFFASAPQSSKMNSMVFWSGTGQPESVNFATSKGRNTLEMLIGDKWKIYQKAKDDGGHWDSWEDAVTNFWDPASEACALASTGEVYVYMTPDRDASQQQSDPTRSTCFTCWYRMEKPNLIGGLGARITLISKYLTTDTTKAAGTIKTMGDKI